MRALEVHVAELSGLVMTSVRDVKSTTPPAFVRWNPSTIPGTAGLRPAARRGGVGQIDFLHDGFLDPLIRPRAAMRSTTRGGGCCDVSNARPDQAFSRVRRRAARGRRRAGWLLSATSTTRKSSDAPPHHQSPRPPTSAADARPRHDPPRTSCSETTCSPSPRDGYQSNRPSGSQWASRCPAPHAAGRRDARRAADNARAGGIGKIRQRACSICWTIPSAGRRALSMRRYSVERRMA